MSLVIEDLVLESDGAASAWMGEVGFGHEVLDATVGTSGLETIIVTDGADG